VVLSLRIKPPISTVNFIYHEQLLMKTSSFLYFLQKSA
jgi:hypothetical protein